MWKKMAKIRCEVLHREPMWPIHGQYECRICGRKYAVPWARPQAGRRDWPRTLPHGAAVNTEL